MIKLFIPLFEKNNIDFNCKRKIMTNDFRKYATKHLGMNGLALDQYMDISSSYISPTIIEERQLNVAQMDVFSRLMMDRIVLFSII